MKMRKYLACLMATLMMASAMVACGGNSESGSDSSVAPAGDNNTPATDVSASEGDEPYDDVIDDDTATTNADSEAGDDSAVEATAADVEFEDAVDAQPGQAYLAMTDSQVWVQYWGSSTDTGYMLAYDAGVADITGNGTYTVSVNADTKGFIYDVTGDVDGEYTPSGIGFAAVIIKDGEKLTPDAIITIDKITIDGKEVEMTGKNYTSTEDGNIRSNIYNHYIDTPSKDARSTEGSIYDEEGNPIVDDADEYTPQIIDGSAIGEWKKIEVTFTVSGMATDAVPVAGGDADSANSETDADADSTSSEAGADAESANSEADASSADSVADGDADDSVIDGDEEVDDVIE